jgi:hypothetical protein
LPELVEPELEVFKQGDLYGVRYKNSNKVVIAPKFYGLHAIDKYYVAMTTPIHYLREVRGTSKGAYLINPVSMLNLEKHSNMNILLNMNGEVIISKPFRSFWISSSNANHYHLVRYENLELERKKCAPQKDRTWQATYCYRFLCDVLEYKLDADLNIIDQESHRKNSTL